MRVSDIAAGRSGDKGRALDLTVVARSDADYAVLERVVTAEAAGRRCPARCRGHEPGHALCAARLRALKFVVAGALPGGVYASLHAGLHWQKAAIDILLDLEFDEN